MKAIEQSLIVTMLTTNDKYFEHSHKIKPELFPSHTRHIKKIREQFALNGSCSATDLNIDVTAWLGLLDIGGFDSNLEKLEKAHRRQKVKDFALSVVAEISNPEKEAEAVADWFNDQVADLFLDKETTLQYIGGSYQAVMDSILGAREGLPGITSGFTEIDEIIPGWQKTNLIVLAARPGMGKTALAMQYALNAARRGKITAVASCEMTTEQLIIRLISSDLEIDSEKINRGKLSPAQIDQIGHWFEENLKTPLVIFHPRDYHDCLNTLRSLKMRTGLDMVVVDYLQLLNLAPERGRSREREISLMSSGFKTFALQNNVPVMLLSQLNRAVESRSDKRPLLSDLRESGAIEQDADIVQFIYRGQYYDSTQDDEAEIITSKHRSGRTGISRLRFKSEFVKFVGGYGNWPDAPF